MDVTSLDAAIAQLGEAARLADVQESVRHAARRVVAADGATFVLRDGNQCFYVDEDAMSPLWKGQRFPLTDCVSGWAMLNHDVAVVPDITQDARVPLAAYRPTFVKSLVMVPIGRVEPSGAIGAYWARVHTATEEDVAALARLADATAAAIARIGTDDAPFLPTSLAPRDRQGRETAVPERSADG